MNNTVKRTLSGIGFVAIMVACLLVNQYLFAALVIFLMAVMMHEFYNITMGSRYRFSRMLAIASGIFLFILIYLAAAYESVDPKYIALALLPLMIVMVNSLYVKDKTDFGKFSDIYTGILYIGVPLSLSNLLVFSDYEFDGTILLCFFIIIWASDIGGYIFGLTLREKFTKKLFESVSPKKTWIGFWGGMICAVIAAVAMHFIGLLDFPLVHVIILAILMDIAGVYGDLFESQWKRHYDVKDSGTIIPGHGGLLDRFDSTIMAMPVGALYLTLFGLL